jgi:hypothetical protein
MIATKEWKHGTREPMDRFVTVSRAPPRYRLLVRKRVPTLAKKVNGIVEIFYFCFIYPYTGLVSSRERLSTYIK